MSEATKRPWSNKHGVNIFGIRSDVGHEGCVASTVCHGSNQVDCTPESEANAELIVQAVNTYDEREALIQEMLIELTYARETIEVLSGFLNSDSPGSKSLKDAMGRMADLIAKAKEVMGE